MPKTRPVADKSEALERLSRRVMTLAKHYQLRSRDRVCRHGITVSQCYALELLMDRGGLLVTELARELSLDKSTASRVADSLTDAGLAEAVEVPGNARMRRLGATNEGAALARRIRREIQAEHRRAFDGFSPEELDACERVLAALGDGGSA